MSQYVDMGLNLRFRTLGLPHRHWADMDHRGYYSELRPRIQFQIGRAWSRRRNTRKNVSHRVNGYRMHGERTSELLITLNDPMSFKDLMLLLRRGNVSVVIIFVSSARGSRICVK